MGYGRYRRRSGNDSRRRRWPGRRREQDALAEVGLIELFGKAVVRVFRAVFRARIDPPERPLPPAMMAPVANKYLVGNQPNVSPEKFTSSPQAEEDYDTAVARIAARLPYRGTRTLLSKGERAFWRSLCDAVGNRYLIFCKVRLADLATAPDERADSVRRFQDLGSFHVDFVLCDFDTTAPLLVIELDDPSHEQAYVRRRDRFKDAVLKASGLPVYRVKCRNAYSGNELSNEIARRIRTRRR